MQQFFSKPTQVQVLGIRYSVLIECYHCSEQWAKQRLSWAEKGATEVRFSLCLCDDCAKLEAKELISTWIERNGREGELKA